MKKTSASRVGVVMMVLAMVLSLSVGAFAASNLAPTTEQAIAIGEQKILEYITEREADYYNVKNVDFEIYDLEESDTGVSFNVAATITHELKADSPAELPYVQGIMRGMSTERSAEALAVFNPMLQEFESHINEDTRMNLYFAVSANVDGTNTVTTGDVQLFALDSMDNKVDVSQFDIPSANEMFEQGYAGAKAMLASVGTTRATPEISNWDKYDRVAARDYAYKWWGPNESDYNPDYTNWNSGGGDCANFVSQCICAGGVPTSNEWKKDSSAWISTSKLASYMTNNGYATKESYTVTNAGNFATKPGHSVLVTINNGLDICYTAHNKNKLDAPFTKTELASTYTFYVIKNF